MKGIGVSFSFKEIKILSRCLFWLQSIVPYSICFIILLSRYALELYSIREVTLLFWLNVVPVSLINVFFDGDSSSSYSDSSHSSGLGTTPCARLLLLVVFFSVLNNVGDFSEIASKLFKSCWDSNCIEMVRIRTVISPLLLSFLSNSEPGRASSYAIISLCMGELRGVY